MDSVGIAECTAVSSGQDVPDHLQELHKQAVAGCQTQDQEQELTALLRKYHDVFSKFDSDVGRTKMVEHSIPLVEGARPIRQPPHRLGPQKEAEANQQVQELLEKGLIELAKGAWNSPVVMVRKKDGGWRFCIDHRQLNAIT